MAIPTAQGKARNYPLTTHDDSHPLHQEAGIHVLGHAGAQAVGEGERVGRHIGFEATVLDGFGVLVG